MAIILPICTKICPKGSSIFHSVKSGDFTYCVCSVLWNSFNSSAGYTELDTQERFANINNGTPLKSVWFRSGSQGAR